VPQALTDMTHTLANGAHSRFMQSKFMTGINSSFSYAKNDANPGGK
jgi:hypothetical protein